MVAEVRKEILFPTWTMVGRTFIVNDTGIWEEVNILIINTTDNTAKNTTANYFQQYWLWYV